MMTKLLPNFRLLKLEKYILFIDIICCGGGGSGGGGEGMAVGAVVLVLRLECAGGNEKSQW